MVVVDGNNYRQRISTVEQTLKLFKKSVEQCDVPVMLENSAQFLESLRTADNFFNQLDPKIKEIEKSTYNKSRNIVKEYFNIRSGIKNFCECKLMEK